MKRNRLFILLLIVFCCLSLAAQEQKEIVLKTQISDVTVFINGAQVSRKKSIDLLPGTTKIRFTNLSPYIDVKSVQVRMDGEVMVRSVNHQSNYLDSIKKSSVSETQEMKLSEIDNEIAIETINQEVIVEELQFLGQNKSIGGSNNGVSLLALKETSNYFRDRVLTLKLKYNEISKRIQGLELKKNAILNEGKQEGTNTNERTPIGEVVVEVDSKKAVRANIELDYYVNNAGWYPSYDIRAINVEKPIELVYKANVRQNTKEDWVNVKLKISSADPNQGNVVPRLKTYYLNYYTAPPRYNTQIDNNQASGVVMDNSNEPLIGVSVVVKGTTIGTVTDLNGRFSLALPQNAKELTFSYVGFESQTLPVSVSSMNVRLKESKAVLDEVVVLGYGTQKKMDNSVLIRGMASGVQVTPASPAQQTFIRKDLVMPTEQIENQTAVEFDIQIPYTVKSDNKNTLVEVDRYELSADYEYFAIPKISKDAFLLANITDWEKYNLLDGEANIFFENTYIGKTILDTRYVSDTLSISLGRDKNILVSREKIKDYNSKKFFGSKKEDTRAWKITVRNNKNQLVNFVVLDQIPISTTTEIEVETQDLSKGSLNEETGEVKWKLLLKPGDKKEQELKYKVKYPKDKVLSIE